MQPNASFWQGKRVLLTGHTGFKGAWLALWLQCLGADVTGIALAPPTTPNLFELAKLASTMRSHVCDIRDAQALAALARHAQPDIVLHLAAQALVRASYLDPLRTYSTNIMGTAHVLDALRGSIARGLRLWSRPTRFTAIWSIRIPTGKTTCWGA